jgi:methionine synthase I (cobalamin-dependent)
MTDLRGWIQDGEVRIVDGAMGTLLYERGVFLNACYDRLNLSHPDRVVEVHQEYVEAGAELLTTNTFGANPVKLSGFDLMAETEEINRVAGSLANGVGGEGVKVLGAMGPLGIPIKPRGTLSRAEAKGFFRRQIRGLIDGGVSGFVLETFSRPEEIRCAVDAVRSETDLPILAQITYEDPPPPGDAVEKLVDSLEAWGVDVIGANCSPGPAHVLDVIERMARVTNLPLIAQPGALRPRVVGDRKMDQVSPQHMAEYAVRMVESGARFIGGCCGTTPAHIRAIRAAVVDRSGRRSTRAGG